MLNKSWMINDTASFYSSKCCYTAVINWNHFPVCNVLAAKGGLTVCGAKGMDGCPGHTAAWRWGTDSPSLWGTLPLLCPKHWTIDLQLRHLRCPTQLRSAGTPAKHNILQHLRYNIHLENGNIVDWKAANMITVTPETDRQIDKCSKFCLVSQRIMSEFSPVH